MNRTVFNIGLVGLLLVFSISNLKSQISTPKNIWWVNLGAGPSLIGRNFGLTAGMVYCYQSGDYIISGRMIGLTNINPTAQRIDPTSAKYKMADYGILIGRIVNLEQFFFSAGAGVGLVRAAYQNPNNTNTNTSISLPIEAQLFWRPTDFAGLGIYTHASFNFEKPLYGLMLCAQLGIW